MPKKRQLLPLIDNKNSKKQKREVEYKIRLRSDERSEWEAKARAVNMNLATFIRQAINRRQIAKVPVVNVETNLTLAQIENILEQHLLIAQICLEKNQPVNINVEVLEKLVITLKQVRREVLGIEQVKSEVDLI